MKEQAEKAQRLRAIIVDDESLARARIRRILQKDESVEIVAECANGPAAVDAVRIHNPDVLFLDIQMPGMDGFAVLQKLADIRIIPHVVFITAFDQYAVRAFEVLALDYLLKPFNELRLQKALNRVRDRMKIKNELELQNSIRALLDEWQSKSRYIEQIAIKEDGRIRIFRVKDIDWIAADSKYVRLHIGRESCLHRESLAALEEQLDSKRFVRIHRSAIVNLSRIKECHPLFHGDMRIILHDGTQLTLSRTCRKRFDELFRLS